MLPWSRTMPRSPWGSRTVCRDLYVKRCLYKMCTAQAREASMRRWSTPLTATRSTWRLVGWERKTFKLPQVMQVHPPKINFPGQTVDFCLYYITHFWKAYASEVNFDYLKTILVHPTSRQNFAGNSEGNPPPAILQLALRSPFLVSLVKNPYKRSQLG